MSKSAFGQMRTSHYGEPRTMHWLEHKIPPPIIGLLVGAAMWAIASVSWTLHIDTNLRIVAGATVALLGIMVAMIGSASFRKAKTTVNPLRPESTSSLVTSGIYRHTRNPMYVGMAAVILGWAIYLAAPLAVLGVAAFVLYITRFQIIPEERALRSKFGAEFAEYQKRVRRWL